MLLLFSFSRHWVELKHKTLQFLILYFYHSYTASNSGVTTCTCTPYVLGHRAGASVNERDIIYQSFFRRTDQGMFLSLYTFYSIQEYTYKLKIINPKRKRDVIMGVLHNFILSLIQLPLSELTLRQNFLRMYLKIILFQLDTLMVRINCGL